MGYRLNRLDEPVFMAVPKPLQTEFGIHYRLESCGIRKKSPKNIKTGIYATFLGVVVSVVRDLL